MKKTMLRKSLFISLLFTLALTARPPAPAAQTQARLFAAPAEAADALAAAAGSNDVAALQAILGPGSKNLVDSGDTTADSEDRALFSAAYARKHGLVPADGKKNLYFLTIGDNDWIFPVPLAQNGKNGRWSFDGKAGEDFLLDRRIGNNELAAMQTCLAVVDAQREYRQMNPGNSPHPHYAAALASSPGRFDGLYWPGGADAPMSPLGLLVAAAEINGYAAPEQGEALPYHGYRYRMLFSQGKNAFGGALNYEKDGLLVNGYALLAYPDRYGVSGVMTFMINQDGILYEKNLGQNTAAEAAKITAFDPDATWGRAEMPDLRQ